MSATLRKVIIRLQDGTLYRGYLPAGGFCAGPEVPLLLPDGRAISVPFGDMLHIAYVRNLNTEDLIDPERIGFRAFPSKPRAGGFWVRVHFSEGDTLEGLIHEDGISFLDSLLSDGGIYMDPPNAQGNTQRLFIPRSAMRKFEILAVTGNTGATKRPRAISGPWQGGLFEGP